MYGRLYNTLHYSGFWPSRTDSIIPKLRHTYVSSKLTFTVGMELDRRKLFLQGYEFG